MANVVHIERNISKDEKCGGVPANIICIGYVPFHPGPPWDAAHEALNSMTQRRNKEFPSMTIYFVLF